MRRRKKRPSRHSSLYPVLMSDVEDFYMVLIKHFRKKKKSLDAKMVKKLHSTNIFDDLYQKFALICRRINDLVLYSVYKIECENVTHQQM